MSQKSEVHKWNSGGCHRFFRPSENESPALQMDIQSWHWQYYKSFDGSTSICSLGCGLAGTSESLRQDAESTIGLWDFAKNMFVGAWTYETILTTKNYLIRIESAWKSMPTRDQDRDDSNVLSMPLPDDGEESEVEDGDDNDDDDDDEVVKGRPKRHGPAILN